MIAWDAALDAIGADDDLQEYVYDRLYGARTREHSERTRKQFQRCLPALRDAVVKFSFDAKTLRRAA